MTKFNPKTSGWAKTDSEGNPGLSVFEHCRHVGYVALELIKQSRSIPHTEINPLTAAVIVAIHDVGKWSPAFLQMCTLWLERENLTLVAEREAWEAQKGVRHEKHSQDSIQLLLQHRGIDQIEAAAWAIIAGAHHGKMHKPENYGNGDPSPFINEWHNQRHQIIESKVDNELDFFAAVDDWQKEGESGAGMTGTLEFNSSVYYRFAALNLGMLADKVHLSSMTVDERKEVVSAFIQATLEAVPGMTESNSGRKNSMNGYTRPAYVLGVVRDKGHPVQLINAFEEPVWTGAGNGIMNASIDALKKEEEALNKTWKLDKNQVERAVMPEVDVDEFISRLVAHVE